MGKRAVDDLSSDAVSLGGGCGAVGDGVRLLRSREGHVGSVSAPFLFVDR